MKKTLSFILAAMLILMLFAGCGAGKYSSPESSAAADTAAVEYDYKSENSAMGKFEDVSEEVFEAPTEESAPETETVPITAALPENVKLIYRADIDMETTEFDSAVNALTEYVGKLNGYFETSSIDNYSNYRHAYYTVRIPAENFAQFCSGVGSFCKVNNLSRSAEDISEVYYDTDSRLATQKTKLTRLQELLAKAENMEDIITIETAISETELMIENLTGTLRKYDSLVGYSTVCISLNEVYRLSDTEEPVIGFGAKLAAAFRSGCSNFVDELQYMAIRFARNWVGWLIFFVLAAVVIVIVVRVVRRHRRKKADRLDVHTPSDKSE